MKNRKRIISPKPNSIFTIKRSHNYPIVYKTPPRILNELIDDLYHNKEAPRKSIPSNKNFNHYINGYRLKAFQEKSLDPANSHYTILGLAYESGFNSKSVFNDFFKKSTGQTPKAWLKAAKKS